MIAICRIIKIGVILLTVLGIFAPSVFAAQSLRMPGFQNYEDRKAGRWSPDHSLEEGDVYPHMFIPGYHSSGNPITVVNGKTVRIIDPEFNVVKNVAFSALCPNGQFTERVVRCIQGVILQSVKTFLAKFELSTQSYILACIILAVTFFGVNIISGKCHHPGNDAFILLLKIGGVLLFTNGFAGMVDPLFGSMESLAGIAATYLTSDAMTYQTPDGQVHMSPFIVGCGSDNSIFGANIWGRIDCIMSRLFIGDASTGLKTGLLWILGGAIFWTSFAGPFIFLIMLFVFGFVGLTVVRCVFTFLSCYLMLAFMVVLSPLIIPLLLFEATMKIFIAAVKIVIASLVMPLVLFFFMVFLFAVFDNLFFQDNGYSLTSHLGVGWEQPQWGPPAPEPVRAAAMKEFEQESGKGPGDPMFEGFKARLEKAREIVAIGIVELRVEPLINIQIHSLTDIDVPVMGQLVNAAGEIIEETDVGEFINEKLGDLSKLISPFEVLRLKMKAMYVGTFLSGILKFLLLALVITYLFMKFSEDIPRIVSSIAGTNLPMPGRLLPGERQLKGIIGAAKNMPKEAAKGAIQGVAKGGKKGAIKGAIKGAFKGALQGYEQGSGKKLSRHNPLSRFT